MRSNLCVAQIFAYSLSPKNILSFIPPDLRKSAMSMRFSEERGFSEERSGELKEASIN